MVATEVKIADGTDMIGRAQKRLKAAIDSDPLNVEDVRFVGNRKALGYAEASSCKESFEDQLRNVEEHYNPVR